MEKSTILQFGEGDKRDGDNVEALLSKYAYRSASALAAALILSFSSGCGGDPHQPNGPSLTLSAMPRSLNGEADENTGNLAAVLATALEEKAAAGTGTVTFTAAAGRFIESGDATVSAALSGGRVTVHFTCNVTEDPACTDVVQLTADWNGLTAQTGIVIFKPLTGASGENP